ncbi:hypothetical protein [Sphingobium sp. CAP-1]|uniref:hypothetical protein n=1 Tax=Sphingobium sp. CAP-1 TaxID=2676077 RepID=UPI0012BB387A|nr:hypothetical protein [Sphingobium sp. CAP-1]QGP78100.1 hypothetical protein GL174_03110 [Sphingobium sp. CAP-1]
MRSLMRMGLLAGLAGLAGLGLAACGESPEQPAASNAAAPETGAAAQVAKLDEPTRNIVFEKAIRASGAACPSVSGSTRAQIAPGVKGWKAQCNNDSAHLIQILPDGTAKVTSRTY